MSFSQALAFTLKEEGGYVDDPADRGGATNRGITQATYDTYRHHKGLPAHGVRDIEDLEAADIYQAMYWSPAHCAELEARLGICHFDWAVNHGVHGAVATLQQALGVSPDGIFGPATRVALGSKPPEQTITNYLAIRRRWYMDRVNAEPDQAKFLAGWLGRVDRLESYLENLA